MAKICHCQHTRASMRRGSTCLRRSLPPVPSQSRLAPALSFRQDWRLRSLKAMKHRCALVRASRLEMVSPSSTRPARSTRTIGARFRFCWSISAANRLLFPAACGLRSWLSHQSYALILSKLHLSTKPHAEVGDLARLEVEAQSISFESGARGSTPVNKGRHEPSSSGFSSPRGPDRPQRHIELAEALK